jgi:tetratricopeptide (TPR) repeat protein
LYLAGKQAARRSANAAAVHDLTAALELLKVVPETAERAQRELTIQTTLGPALMAIEGHASPEIEKVYTRALELCRRLGEAPEIFPVVCALSRFYLQRGDVRRSLELAQNCLQLAPSFPDSGLLVEGHRLVGMNFMHLGDLAGAREHLEQGINFYDSARHDWAQFYGSDPEIVSLCYLSNLIWLLGYPDQALRKSTHLIATARARGHYPSLAGAWHFVAFVHQARGELQQCQTVPKQGWLCQPNKDLRSFLRFRP